MESLSIASQIADTFAELTFQRIRNEALLRSLPQYSITSTLNYSTYCSMNHKEQDSRADDSLIGDQEEPTACPYDLLDTN